MPNLISTLSALPTELRRAHQLTKAAGKLKQAGRVYEAELCLKQAVKMGLPAFLARDLPRLSDANQALPATMVRSELASLSDPIVADQAFLKGYQAFFEGFQNSRYMDFPKQFHLETAAQCNAACNFCPYIGMERRGTRMPDELLYKILNEMRDIPTDLPFEICPFKVNEPFLDSRLFDVLHFIDTNLENASVIITTNATPLTAKNIDRLSQVRSMGYLLISFADHRKEAYEKAMSIPYDRTMARLRGIHNAAETGELKFPIHITRVGDGTAGDAEYIEWSQKTFPLFAPQVYQRQNWLGQVDVNLDNSAQHVGCHRWFEMSITATGAVSHCCMDGEGKWPIGDVSKGHILDVYNQSPLRALRQDAIVRTASAPCAGCALRAR